LKKLVREDLKKGSSNDVNWSNGGLSWRDIVASGEGNAERQEAMLPWDMGEDSALTFHRTVMQARKDADETYLAGVGWRSYSQRS